jgi:hypothetical protein
MIIDTTVRLSGPDENFPWTADQAAAQVLAALGGNPTVDTATCSISMASVGIAGVDPNNPPPSEEPTE